MNRTEHLRRLLAGERVAPAVACWYHFAPELHAPQPAADAHLRHRDRFDLDFIKVMTEVGYPREALGTRGVVTSCDDLRKLGELPGDARPFDAHLDTLRRLADRVGGEVPLTSTVFHAWITLRNLTAPAKSRHSPPVIDVGDDPRDALLTRLLQEDAPAVAAALDAIGRTLANFARACLDAGADGIYLATRDDWVDTPANNATVAAVRPGESSAYDALLAPTDDAILQAARDGWFNMIHLCGHPLRFDRWLKHPQVHVVHWADRVTGPSIADACEVLNRAAPGAQPAMAAGVDNLSTLPNGSPQDIADEVRAALAERGDRPLIVAPGCTYDPEHVPDENIRAMVAAARG